MSGCWSRVLEDVEPEVPVGGEHELFAVLVVPDLDTPEVVAGAAGRTTHRSLLTPVLPTGPRPPALPSRRCRGCRDRSPNRPSPTSTARQLPPCRWTTATPRAAVIGRVGPQADPRRSSPTPW